MITFGDFDFVDFNAILVEGTSTPIFEMGRLDGAVALFRDLRERKREQRLRVTLAEVAPLKRRLALENEYHQEGINAELNHHACLTFNTPGGFPGRNYLVLSQRR